MNKWQVRELYTATMGITAGVILLAGDQRFTLIVLIASLGGYLVSVWKQPITSPESGEDSR